MDEQEKAQFVHRWLKAKYKHQPVPPFEITPRTMDVLYRLAQVNMSRDADVDLLILDAEQHTKEQDARKERLRAILGGAGIEHHRIGQSLAACLTALASLAVLLDIRDTEHSSYCIGITELQSQLEELSRAQSHEKAAMQALQSKTQSVVQRMTDLQLVLSRLPEQANAQRQIASRRVTEIHYALNKSEEHRATLAAQDPDLVRYAQTRPLFDPGFARSDGDDVSNRSPPTHDRVVAEAQRLTQLQGVTNQMNERLAAFMNLPPDLTMAQIKIDEAKARLKELEEQLSAKLSDIM